MENIEPRLITESKRTFKDILIKAIKLQRRPLVIRVSDKEANNGKKNLTARIVTEIARKKDKQVIKVRTDINTRYLLKI